MARILYGIHGTGHGHAMRGLTIARALPQHEFLFVANDDAPAVLEPEFRVCRLPNLGTVFKNYRVDFYATIKRAAGVLGRRKQYLAEALDIVDDFKPDVCITDLEYFVPRAARQAGLPCLTLDHQHIITCCRHQLPPNMWTDAFIQGLTPKYLFRPTESNLLISFYAPPLLPRYNAVIAPPILRDAVINASTSAGDYILVYQSNSTDSRLIDFLRTATARTCYVFGYANEPHKEGHVIFRPKSEHEFIELLAGCAYVIQGGSHTLMSEALFLKKPVLSLPLEAMVEQRFNAYYLEKLGYGKQARMADLDKKLLDEFESDLPFYEQNIGGSRFLGNSFVFESVDHFASTGNLPILAGS